MAAAHQQSPKGVNYSTKDASGQYAAVLCHMEHLSSTSKNSDIKVRAKFVCEKMKTMQFAAFCHFLADMFAIISRLSLNMQRNDLILPVAVSLIRETSGETSCPVPSQMDTCSDFLACWRSLQMAKSSFKGLR